MSFAFSPRKPGYLHLRIGFGCVAALLFSAAAGGCTHAPPPKMNKVFEVVVTTPVTEEVTDYQDFTGRMDALKTVDIRPRVSGYIFEAPFVEGDIVKTGDLLFQVDPRPYQAEVNQAKANLKLAQADVVLQTKTADRGRQLIGMGNGAIGPQDYDQLVAARDKAVANVGAMKAALERAELNLEFTHITVPSLGEFNGKPLIGRISRRMVDPGNLVNADQTVLTTLVSIDPMYAYFDVDERTYLDLATLTYAGTNNSWFSALQFPVLMKLANEDEFHTKGYVNFLDNRLNANTGTVRMRGVFANPSDVLKPGLFVRIRLPLGVPYKALMIPDEAILSDQGRKYVYVVKNIKKVTDNDGKEVERGEVEYRSVTPGLALQGLRVIKKGEVKEGEKKEGIEEGERVIVSGMQRVRPGAGVIVTMQKPQTPPKSQLTEILKEVRATKKPDPKTAVAPPSLKDMPRVGGKSEQSKSALGGKGR
ncbi:MAG TPA: efflux RND transporter periplasmic adaptor subunit [Gemmataceae bacterium]|nr:efflux RND transporter periplasmic adaptor subunit [Gemmataceae bacterium]